MDPPVIVFSISALELLLLPPAAEVCFGGWCHVSLEDERYRVIELLYDLVKAFSPSSNGVMGGGGVGPSSSTHQQATGGEEEVEEETGAQLVEALQIPWATHLGDFYAREEVLKRKYESVQELKRRYVHASDTPPPPPPHPPLENKEEEEENETKKKRNPPMTTNESAGGTTTTPSPAEVSPGEVVGEEPPFPSFFFSSLAHTLAAPVASGGGVGVGGRPLRRSSPIVSNARISKPSSTKKQRKKTSSSTCCILLNYIILLFVYKSIGSRMPLW